MKSTIIPILLSISTVMASVIVMLLFGEALDMNFTVTALFYIWATYCPIKLLYGIDEHE